MAKVYLIVFVNFLPEGFPDDTMKDLTKVLSNNRDVDAIKMNQFNQEGIFIFCIASLYHVIEFVDTT